MDRLSLSRVVVSLSVLVAFGCKKPPPPRPRPVARAIDAGVRDAAVNDPFAQVRARGPLHGEPIEFRGTNDHGVGRVVFTGETQALGAWVLTDGPQGSSVRAVEAWPIGVRVRFGVATEGGREVLVLIETVPALDRSSRQRSAVVLARGSSPESAWTVRPFPVRALEQLAGVVDAAGLLSAYEAGATRDFDDRRCTAIRTAARTPAGLARVIPPVGLDHYVRYTDGLVLRAEVLTTATFAASPSATAIAAAVMRSSEGQCDTETVGVIEAGPDLRVRAVVTDAMSSVPPLVLPPDSTPRRVAERGTSSSIEAPLRARFEGDVRVIGSAPLTERGGVVAVAQVQAFEPNVVAIDEGGVVRTLSLGRAVNINDDGVTAVRFLDANGDGRTDVAVESASSPTGGARDGGAPFAHRGLYLTPRGSLSAALEYDLGSAVVMNTAADLDAAVAALAQVAWRGVSPREACPLVSATGAAASVRSVSTADLRVVFFEEPGSYAWNSRFRPISEYVPTDPWWSGVVGCQHLECDPHRPVCTAQAEPGPASNAYWFTWEGGRLRLAAYAIYNGS